MAKDKKSDVKKKKKDYNPNGVVHINSSFNNTIITIADTNGNAVSWSSSGSYAVLSDFFKLTCRYANVLFENESSNNNALGIICSMSISFENNFSGGI